MRFTASEGKALKERRFNMGYMRIKCHYCGGTWEVYGRSVTNGDYAGTCPHCFKVIERQTWEKQIIPAFHALDDANR